MRPYPFPRPTITDTDGLAPQFDEYYSGSDRVAARRIKVRTVWADGESHTRTGLVGRTTGWRPTYLLMRRRTDSGSSDVLGPADEIVAVETRPGSGRYEPVR